jgi:hypothetical protein
MSETRSGDGGERAPLARGPVIIAAVVCGTMAVAGLTAAFLTSAYTPRVFAIPVHVDGIGSRLEDKWFYLLAPQSLLWLTSIAMIYFAMTWGSFVRNATKTVSFDEFDGSLMRDWDLDALSKGAFVCVSAFQGAILLLALHRCSVVLNFAGILHWSLL